MVIPMVRSRFSHLLIALLLTASALAGCLGADELEDDDATDDSTGGPSEDMGSVEGQVAGAGFAPIEGADVMIVKDDEAVASGETGADGHYAFHGLEPEVYRVQVSAVGFHGDVAPARVDAGKTVTVNLVLEPLPDERPWSDRYDFEGLMGLGYHGPGPAVTCCQADSNHKISFSFEVRPDLLETMVIEMAWPEEHVGLLMNVWLNPECDPNCTPDHDYTEHSEDDNLGWGGLEMRIDRPDGGWPQISGDEDVELWIYVWADSGEEPATLAYQQRFEIFMENFYVDPAPEGHSPRGDG